MLRHLSQLSRRTLREWKFSRIRVSSFWHWAFGLEGLGWYRGHWCHHHPTPWIHDFGGSRGPHNWLPQKLWAVRGVHFGLLRAATASSSLPDSQESLSWPWVPPSTRRIIVETNRTEIFADFPCFSMTLFPVRHLLLRRMQWHRDLDSGQRLSRLGLKWTCGFWRKKRIYVIRFSKGLLRVFNCGRSDPIATLYVVSCGRTIDDRTISRRVTSVKDGWISYFDRRLRFVLWHIMCAKMSVLQGRHIGRTIILNW